MEKNWTEDLEGLWLAFKQALHTLIIVRTREEPRYHFGYRPEWQVWTEVVLTQAACITALGFGVIAAFDCWDSRTMFFVFLGATSVWWFLFFFAGGLPKFVVNIEEFHAGVFTSMLTRNRLPKTEAEQITLSPTLAMREVGWGLRPRRLWERVTIIDMRRQRLIVREFTSYTSDGIKLTLQLLLPLSPLWGCLCNLVRHIEATIDDRMIADLKAAAGEYIMHNTGKYILENIGELTGLVKNFKGGPNHVDADEEQTGTFTGRPSGYDVLRSAEYQRSCEAREIARNTAFAAKKLMLDKSVDGQRALETVMALEKDAGMEIRIIHGLENLTAVGGAFNLFGDGKRSKNKDKNKKENKEGDKK